MKIFPHALPALAAALLAAGCGTPPPKVVMPSNLNYANITYANTNRVVMMEFQGTGYCTMRSGKEAGITNPFSQTAHQTKDLRQYFSPSEMTYIFQVLVNAGVYEEEPDDVRAPALPYVGISGRIENSGFSRHSRTPEFLKIAEDMLALFEKPEQYRQQLRLQP